MLSNTGKIGKKKLSDIIPAVIVKHLFERYFDRHQKVILDYLQAVCRLPAGCICHVIVMPEKIYENSAMLPIILDAEGKRIFDDDPMLKLEDAVQSIVRLPAIALPEELDPEVIDVELSNGDLKSLYLFVTDLIASEFSKHLPVTCLTEIRVGLHDDNEPIVITKL